MSPVISVIGLLWDLLVTHLEKLVWRQDPGQHHSHPGRIWVRPSLSIAEHFSLKHQGLRCPVGTLHLKACDNQMAAS